MPHRLRLVPLLAGRLFYPYVSVQGLRRNTLVKSKLSTDPYIALYPVEVVW